MHHSVREMEEILPGGEWARAMRDLLAVGFAFDRLVDGFRIRRKLSVERKQALVELLDGIDVMMAEEPVVVPVEEDEVPVVPFKPKVEPEAFDPTVDGGEPEAREEQLCLSLDKDELTDRKSVV